MIRQEEWLNFICSALIILEQTCLQPNLSNKSRETDLFPQISIAVEMNLKENLDHKFDWE